MKFDLKEWVLDSLDNPRKSAGSEYTSNCPWCGRPDHFYVNVKSGKYICFRCDERGTSAVGIIAEVEGITRGEAYRMLLRAADIKRRRQEEPASLLERVARLRGGNVQEKEPVVEVDRPDEFIPVFDGKRWRMPAYLSERRLSREIAMEFGLGYCTTGRYADRIVMPIECPAGRSFTARDATGGQMPKYLNPEDAKHGRLLYGWAQAVRRMLRARRPVLVLVEGPVDVLKMSQHGYPSLGIFGNQLRSAQVSLFSRWPRETVVFVMLDPEETVRRFAVAQQLTVRFSDIRLAELPPDVDPGKSLQQQAQRALRDAEPFVGGAVGRTKAIEARLAGTE